MANKARGEGVVHINGTPTRVTLTLGALAEIEDDLGVPLGQMQSVVEAGRIKPIVTILYWMIRAGGNSGFKREDLLTSDIQLDEVIAAFEGSMKGIESSIKKAERGPAEGNG